MHKGLIKAAVMLTAAVVLTAACGTTGTRGVHAASEHTPAATTSTAELRTTLDEQLGAHVYLAAFATGNALAGNTKGFEAAAAALDRNSQDLAATIATVYPSAREAFLALWRKHIGFFVDYTQGVAAKDKAKQDKAVADLLQYTQDFGAFLASANPNLTKDGVAVLVKEHALGLKAVVDAQAARNDAAADVALRMAFAHMDMIGDAVADAIAKQFPDRFPGEANGAQGTLRSGVTQLLGEHALLAGHAIGAYLGGDVAGFTAGADSLDRNSVELAGAVGSVYPTAKDAFLALWRKHIGFFVDYAKGISAKDKPMQDKAVGDLVTYTQDFGAFLASANPNLTKDAVAGLVKDHVLGLKKAVDELAAGEATSGYADLYQADLHMGMIGGALAGAIVKQFPAKFAS